MIRLAVASLKFAAMLILAAGVGVGLGDGDEFDQAGCSVAQRPAGKSHRGSSGKAEGGGGGNVARTGAGSDGRTGDGGHGDGGPPSLEQATPQRKNLIVKLLAQNPRLRAAHGVN